MNNISESIKEYLYKNRPERSPDLELAILLTTENRIENICTYASKVIGGRWKEAEPKIWLMENVRNMLKWYKKEPIWYFRISKRGYRCLWGNIKITKHFDNSFADTRDIWRTYGWNTRQYRAKIPYEVARFIADIVKENLARRVE